MAKVEEPTDQAAQMAQNPPTTGHAAEVETTPPFSGVVNSHLEQIYNTLATSHKGDFLDNVQKEVPTGTNNGESADHLVSLAAFQAYMASSASSAQRPVLKQHTAAPITDYFISSSHNTYLTGNQLYSDAAASAYTNVSLISIT